MVFEGVSELEGPSDEEGDEQYEENDEEEAGTEESPKVPGPMRALDRNLDASTIGVLASFCRVFCRFARGTSLSLLGRGADSLPSMIENICWKQFPRDILIDDKRSGRLKSLHV